MFSTIYLFFSAQHNIEEVDLRGQHHPCFGCSSWWQVGCQQAFLGTFHQSFFFFSLGLYQLLHDKWKGHKHLLCLSTWQTSTDHPDPISWCLSHPFLVVCCQIVKGIQHNSLWLSLWQSIPSQIGHWKVLGCYKNCHKTNGSLGEKVHPLVAWQHHIQAHSQFVLVSCLCKQQTYVCIQWWNKQEPRVWSPILLVYSLSKLLHAESTLRCNHPLINGHILSRGICCYTGFLQFTHEWFQFQQWIILLTTGFFSLVFLMVFQVTKIKSSKNILESSFRHSWILHEILTEETITAPVITDSRKINQAHENNQGNKRKKILGC